MTQTEVKAYIFKSIPADFGKSFDELKKEILKTKRCSSTDHFKSGNGYDIYFTDNANYMQGAWNGGGAGWFASLHQVGFVQTIKL